MNTEIINHINQTFITFIKQRFDDKTAETIVHDWLHPYTQFKLQNDRNSVIYKKPTTAFNFFVDANKQLVSQKTGLSDDNLIQELKNLWKKLNKETRETYINMNLILKQEYEKKNNKYYNRLIIYYLLNLILKIIYYLFFNFYVI